MIKIPNDAFRWDILNDIYGKNGPLVQGLRSKISTIMSRKRPPAAVVRLFTLWFYENGMLSAKRISAFLMDRHPRDRIREYNALPASDAANKVFARVFNYDTFARTYRDRVIAAMGISVCPYCNRQYITTYVYGGKAKATADLDHFYSKSRYPFLALSLYNFVPSCSVCNSRLKRDVDFAKRPHVNPHERGFGRDALFRLLDPMCIANRALIPECKLENYTGDRQIERSIETFRLNAVYERSHADYVRELIDKARAYETAQLEEYLSTFGALFPGGPAQALQLLYGNYLAPDDACRRPLSKLTQDLLFQLGIIPDPYS